MRYIVRVTQSDYHGANLPTSFYWDAVPESPKLNPIDY